MLFKSESGHDGYNGSGGLKNMRNTQRRHNGLSLFRLTRSLCLAVDDPCTQEHPKSRGLQQIVHEKERDLVGYRSVLILGMPHHWWSLSPRQRGGRRRMRWRSAWCPSLGCPALGAELKGNGEDANDLHGIVLSPLRIRPPLIFQGRLGTLRFWGS